MSAKQTRDPEAALESTFAKDKSGKGLEVWGILAHAVFAAFLIGLLYLGARPGGPTPVFVFLEGRFLLALIAMLVIAIGVGTSVLRRPFLQRGRLRSFIFVVVVFGLVNMQFPYPSPHEGHPSLTLFELPVQEEWTVFWGGEDSESNRLATFLPDRRFGMDLVLVEDGKCFDGDGAELEDWYCFGKAVLAPANGVVRRVRSDSPDQLPRNYDRTEDGPVEGNVIVIETGEDEYCFLAHLKQESLLVGVGDTVVAGQPIAEVGSSGFSAFTPMPHLALHLQDTPNPRGEAIPWRFTGYFVGTTSVGKGLPQGGVAKDGSPRGERVSRQAAQ